MRMLFFPVSKELTPCKVVLVELLSLERILGKYWAREKLENLKNANFYIVGFEWVREDKKHPRFLQYEDLQSILSTDSDAMDLLHTFITVHEKGTRFLTVIDYEFQKLDLKILWDMSYIIDCENGNTEALVYSNSAMPLRKLILESKF